MDNKRLDILIARIKESGDETAFAEFYELTSKGLFSYLLSIVRRREVAEDLMQDTYVRFRQSVQSYKSGNPAAFLIEIGKNIAFNHIKRAKYETATDFSEWEPVSGEERRRPCRHHSHRRDEKGADRRRIANRYAVRSGGIQTSRDC